MIFPILTTVFQIECMSPCIDFVDSDHEFTPHLNKKIYQQIPSVTLKVVWVLLNRTEFLLIKVHNVVPSTAKK